MLRMKKRTLDLPHETNIVTSKLESQNSSTEIYDLDPEIMFTQTTDPIIGSKLQFRKYYKDCHKSSHFVSKCFRKQGEADDRKRKP